MKEIIDEKKNKIEIYKFNCLCGTVFISDEYEGASILLIDICPRCKKEDAYLIGANIEYGCSKYKSKYIIKNII